MALKVGELFAKLRLDKKGFESVHTPTGINDGFHNTHCGSFGANNAISILGERASSTSIHSVYDRNNFPASGFHLGFKLR